jgi:alpha-beta hydrolase superfamily lysophospholipase
MPLRLTGRRVAIGLAVALLAVVAALFGAAWYFSDVLEADGLVVDHVEDEMDLTVTAIQREGTAAPRVTLSFDPGNEDLAQDVTRYEVWGLEGESFFAQLLGVVSADRSSVTRLLGEVSGEIRVGDEARLNRNHIPLYRSEAPGLATAADEGSEVQITGPLGDLPAWLLPAPGGRKWAILVHGRTSERDETLRAWTSFSQAGYTSLIVTYRNDIETAPDPSGYYQFGRTEWADLEPAVQIALDSGAEEVVLAGFSMGGAVVMSFMERSALADEVDRLVLDAPMLDFGRTVDLGAHERRVPGIVTRLAKWLAGMRFDVDWDALNYLSRAETLDVPVLLIHGDDDDTVPVQTSRELAELLPELVTYEEFPDAGHVTSWNNDPARYGRVLLEFLPDR